MKPIRSLLLALLTALTCPAQPGSSSPPRVMLATDDMSPVPASLADVAWIVGAWEGPLGDDLQEHIAYPAVGGQIPGFVRGWKQDNAITFYEINAFAEVEGTLEFRVKHFTAALAGWEPREDFVRHRLLAKTGDTLFFDGITFVRSGSDRHTVFYRIPSGERAGDIITVHQRRRPAPPTPAHRVGEVVTLRSESQILRDNRIGLNPERTHRVYLPPSYGASPGRRYAVVYFCHNTYWSPEQMFADGNLQRLLERGFAAGVVPEFILVGVDATGPTTGSLSENSSTSGRWLDYLVEEMVPLVDERFRTIADRDSRAVVGDFWGGYAALKLAMLHADRFGSSYALHPVATGNGDLPTTYLDIDWPAVHAASSWDALPPEGRSRMFTAISQAFLPNPERPPFYCDFPVEMKDGESILHPDNTSRLQHNFLLEEQLKAHAANLRSLRGLALDWGRFDPTQAHVVANRRFSRQLTDLGVEHDAEEYAGGPWDRTWTPDGRFATRVLPFLARHVVFADITFIAISSSNGRFGGLRTANAHYAADAGLVGVYAPGVAFDGPVIVGEINASHRARPVLVLGSASDVRIAGGDMMPANGLPIEVSGISRLRFTAGSDSHGRQLAAQVTEATFTQRGRDVTDSILAGP